MSAPSLTPSHIARALDEMLTERSLLAARLQKLDTLIAAMRDAFHLPADRKPRANGHAKSNGNGHATVSDAAIRTALAAESISPGELARTLGVDRATLRPQLRALEQRGVIVVTGVTASRRVALAPGKGRPAKEAP